MGSALRIDLNTRCDDRKDVHECSLACGRSLQIPPSPRMFCRQQILEGIRRVFPAEGMHRDDGLVALCYFPITFWLI